MKFLVIILIATAAFVVWSYTQGTMVKTERISVEVALQRFNDAEVSFISDVESGKDPDPTAYLIYGVALANAWSDEQLTGGGIIDSREMDLRLGNLNRRMSRLRELKGDNLERWFRIRVVLDLWENSHPLEVMPTPQLHQATPTSGPSPVLN